MYCQMFSAALSSGHTGGNGNIVRFFVTPKPADLCT
jgi:hypothetical protein